MGNKASLNINSFITISLYYYLYKFMLYLCYLKYDLQIGFWVNDK